MAKSPDILFIVLDTLRRDRLSAYGHQRCTSPALDAFADQATVFDRAVSAAQWTVPSHTAMFTGLYPSTHGVLEANHVLSGSFPTIAEILQVADYHTVAFCNNPMVGLLDHGLTRGFDRYYNYAGPTPNRPRHEQQADFIRASRRHAQPLMRRFSNRLAHSDALFRLSLNPLFVPIWTRWINYKGDTKRSIDDLIDYHQTYQAQQRDEPLFMFLNLMGAHMPHYPPRQSVEAMAPELKGDRRAFDYMGRLNAEAARWASPPDEPLTEWETFTIQAFYDAEIRHQDAELGRLLDHLRATGKLDDMMVIIVADHGEGHGDHDFFGHSFVVYQELVHVPLIIHYPDKFPRGQRASQTVSTRRVFHTMLDAAGLVPPIDEDEDPNADVERLTLANAIGDARDPEDGLAFSEAYPPQSFLYVMEHHNRHLIERMQLTQVRRGVYQDEHKLARVGDQIEGLFNVADDPDEVHDRASDDPARAQALSTSLDQFVQDALGRRAEQEPEGAISDEVIDNLRALGYFE